MDEARNTDAIRQFIQDFIAKNYKRSVTLKKVRDELPSILRTDDERHRFKTHRDGLVFDVEGIGQRIFYVSIAHMNDCMSASELQEQVSLSLAREITRVLGLPTQEGTS